MTRSLKKGPFVDEKLFRKVLRAKDTGSHAPIRTWSRRCTIVPEFVGVNFEVHNGKVFHKLFVTEEMVGHKLGEFSPTRNFRGHGGKVRAAAAAGAPAAASAGGPAKAPASGK
ncbi:MAG: 30S ribosomal protein S19 [Phycisphaerae bacterium]|nr:30S ribosomal protein S19 [Phycisphaerae bacterium]